MQQRVHQALRDITGLPLGADMRGIDGCSVPNWAMPLSVMARAFAKLVTGEGMSAERRAAVGRILDACWQYPDMVAGKSRADTVVMRALPRQVFMKTGAEGVYCGAFPELGLGFALKVEDGAKRAAAGAAMALVERLYPAARGLMPVGSLKTWRGLEVGEVRSSPLFEDTLARLKV